MLVLPPSLLLIPPGTQSANYKKAKILLTINVPTIFHVACFHTIDVPTMFHVVRFCTIIAQLSCLTTLTFKTRQGQRGVGGVYPGVGPG